MAIKKIMERTGRAVRDHPGAVVGVILFITVLLVLPLMNLEMESGMRVFGPDDEVIRAGDTIEADFPDPVQRVYTVVVAVKGNVLDRECLLEMLAIEDSVRGDKAAQEYLVEDPDSVTSIADATSKALSLEFDTTLEEASDVQLDQAIGRVLQAPELRSMVSGDLDTENGSYGAKAAIIVTQMDNILLGPDNEEGQLAVIDAVLKTDCQQTTVGVLGGEEAEMEEGMADGVKLLPICLALIIIVLYLSLRSVVDVLLSLIGIPIVFVWMFGISGAIGLKITELSSFAPILIIAMGIDYAIHSLRRYREERNKGVPPKDAAKFGITHTGTAILLATVTTVAAFFSTVLSSIRGTRDFGLMIGIGIISAFVIMGIFIPALRLILDEHRRKPRKKTVSKQLGRSEGKPEGKHPLSQALVQLSAMPLVLIPVVLAITAVSLFGALQLGTELSPKDFLPKDSGALAAMDLMIEHFPQSGTETAEILASGSVSDPAVLNALGRTAEGMKDDEHVSNIGGTPQIVCIRPYVEEVMRNPKLVAELGVRDDNSDLIPDSEEGVIQVYDLLYENGIGDATTTDIKHVLHRDPVVGYDKTLMWIDIVDHEGLENKKEIRDELQNDSRPLYALEEDGLIDAVVTGEPLLVYTTQKAMSKSMFSSIAICFIVCFVVLLLVFWSFKFSIVTVVPVCLVAVWILGTMYVLGYSFNVITILIVAMSIGVGIDYSIHITCRYREERANGEEPKGALGKTLSSTGVALLGAAGTTSLGFAVLAFASMNAFVTFGILTALMVVYSLIAAVFVLPMMLMLVDRKNRGSQQEAETNSSDS